MATANVAPPDTQTANAPSRRRRDWRRPPRTGEQGPPQGGGQGSATIPQTNQGGGSRVQPARDALLTLRPASVAPRSQPPSASEASSAESSAVENGIPREPRSMGGRGGRGGRGGGAQNTQAHGVRGRNSQAPQQPAGRSIILNSGRQFGGRLTTDTDENRSPPMTSSLQADAPEFRPGQTHLQRNVPARRGRAAPPISATATRLRRGSSVKSAAPDIASRTHEDIANGVYECPICTSEVGRQSKVWSCKTCWTVFHLTCIKRWARNEGSTQAAQQPGNGDLPPPRQWRCPGCNLPKDDLPTTYSCWCRKEVDPRAISGLPPHSCGQTCGKPRVIPKQCPHPCQLFCHAGPCPPCSHMGPIQSCFCGKKSTSRRCVDTNYATGWSCDEVCGDLMPCGEHTCQRPCHEGLCGACELRIDTRCYCGKVEKPIVCCKRGEEKESARTFQDHDTGQKVENWMGMFDCGNTCARLYDCGKHVCEKQCHPQERQPPHCPRSPDVVSHCPCGKTLLSAMSSAIRTSCEDPIPNCTKECSRRLPCGHKCRQVCHSGECIPCLMTVSINCRCGRTSSQTVCHQGTEESPQCLRSCKVTLNCGRHECGERCCSGERKAAERQATKRRLRPLGLAPRTIDEGFEAEHICTRLCGRMLKCGNHTCPELCHKGPCGSCREAIFDEISCHCGRTVLQPPLPCGTDPPPCRFDCERPKNCGHPQVPHNCHGDEASCPKCPFLTEKACMCGKKTLKNQQCWLADVRCGEVCGRKLKCGSHYCRKPCHRPGECEDAGKACQQSCGKAKKFCGHPCEEPCHAPSSCREDKPCQNKLLITCDCQHLKQEIKCNASKTSEGNSKKSLKCDDECARLERNRKLALALNIDPEAHKDEHIPYSAETLRMFQEHVTWGQTQEREFRVFAADAAEKRLRFKPMPAKQRAFIHALADDFAFDSESMDPEPHRHVAVFKTPKFVTAPTKTLAECVRMRRHVESSSLAAADAQKKLRAGTAPYNGILLSHARFGLTLEELRAEFAATLTSTPTLAFDISFLPSEEIALKARAATASLAIPAPSIEAALKTLKPALLSLTSSKHLAASLQLCALDASLNILRREVDSAADGDGWSQVAAKAAAPRVAPRLGAVGERSVFTVLGRRGRGERERDRDREREREMVREMVVEDWEVEAGREEGVGEVDGGEKGEGDAAEKGEGDAAEEGDGDGAEKREGDGAEKIEGDGAEIGAGGGDALGGLVAGAGGQEDGVVDDEKEELPVAEDRPASSGEEAEAGGTAHQ